MAHRGVYIDHLQNLTLFVACSRKDLQHIARRAKERDTSPPGQPSSPRARTATSSSSSSTAQPSCTATDAGSRHSGPGNAFGELALLGDAPRNATVVAETDAELVVVSEPDFTGLLERSPASPASSSPAPRTASARQTPAPSNSRRILSRPATPTSPARTLDREALNPPSRTSTSRAGPRSGTANVPAGSGEPRIGKVAGPRRSFQHARQRLWRDCL